VTPKIPCQLQEKAVALTTKPWPNDQLRPSLRRLVTRRFPKRSCRFQGQSSPRPKVLPTLGRNTCRRLPSVAFCDYSRHSNSGGTRAAWTRLRTCEK